MDLLVLLRSFLPKGGSLSAVTVYPTLFGMKQMEEEQKKGPTFLTEGARGRRAAEEGKEAEEEAEAEAEAEAEEEEEEEEEEAEDRMSVNNRLRKYEKQRLQ